MPEGETVAAAVDEPIEMEPVIRAKSTKNARASKRPAKRSKQVAIAETQKPARIEKAAPVEKPTKVVAIAGAKPMRIGATTVAPGKGTGTGKLTVASTPATLIYVDGRNTGMMTPRTLALPEGSHTITLLSPKDRIAKTLSVDIAAGKSTSLSKTFTK
jgi:hypothetical protein